MPKNIKKEEIKKAILADEIPLVEIGKQFGVTQPYVSQLKIEAERDDFLDKLRFLYNIMNNKMAFKVKPTIDEAQQIKEVRAKI